MSLSRALPARCLLVLTLATLAACTAQPLYREVRKPAPGGGFYIERIRLQPGEKLEKPVRSKTKQSAPALAQTSASGTLPEAKVGQELPSATPVSAPSTAARADRKPWWRFWGRKPVEAPAKPVDDGSYWIGEGVTGKPKIVISLGEQVVRYYKGAELVGLSPMSSGREGFQTVVGKFAVSEKDEDHKSSLYGNYVDQEGVVLKEDVDVRKDPRPAGAKFDGADMRWFMRITGAIGMHEGYLPGFPASHGCIRLPSRMAKIFYEATPHGTAVEIVP